MKNWEPQRTVVGLILVGVSVFAFAQQPSGGKPAAPAAAQEIQIPDVQTPDELRFDIERFNVTGNTLLHADDIERAIGPFVGKRRDFGDVQRALEELEHVYRERGYSAVQVYLPEQELDKGVVTLRVVEARLKGIDVKGNVFFYTANIVASLPSLKPGTTPNANVVAKNLRIVNESPAKQTNVTMRAGEAEGEVDVIVDVTEENPKKAFVTLDNSGTGSSGYHRVGFGYQNSNLFGRDHAMTLQFITSLDFPRKVSVYSLGYRLPLYDRGASIDLIAAYSDTNAGTTLTPAGPFSFSGAGGTLGARYNQHLDRPMPGYDHKLVWAVDHRMYRNACSLGAFGVAGCGSAGQTFSLTPISLGYVGTKTLKAGILTFNASAHSNISFGSSYDNAKAIAGARFGASTSYRVYKFGVNWAQALADDWQARARFDLQHTNEVLVPAEQFGIGGQASVRGFLERERGDDRGHSGSLELYAPDMAGWLNLTESSLRLLGFFDFGRTRRVNALPGEVVENGLSSFGLGMRYTFQKANSMRLDVARIQDEGGSRISGHYRAHVGVVWAF